MHWAEHLSHWQKNLWIFLYMMLSSTSHDSAWIAWYSWIFVPLSEFVSLGTGGFWRRSVCPLWSRFIHIKNLFFLMCIISKRGKILQHFSSCWNLRLKVVGMYCIQVWNVRDIINHIMSVFVDGWCTFSKFLQYDMIIFDLNVQDLLNSCHYWNMNNIHGFVFYLWHHCGRLLKAFRKSQNLVSQC